MHENAHSQRGFTLIEIISVLVILGILAAVAVPKYFDLQEESEKKAALGSVAEAQARIQLRFGQLILQGNTCEKAVLEVNELKKLADSTDDGNLFGEFILSAAPITTAGVAVSAKRKGNSGDTIDTGAKLYVPDCEGVNADNGMGAGNAAFDFASAINLTGIVNYLDNHIFDSTVPDGKSSFFAQINKEFLENNIDPRLSDINSWAYSGNSLYWSKTDISTLNANQENSVVVMKYDTTTKQYSVGTVSILSKKHPNNKAVYNVFNTEKFKSTATNVNFEEALARYNSLTRK